MKKIVISLIGLLLLAACSTGNKEEITKTVCVNDSPYLVYESGVQTYTAIGDKVLKMEIKAVLELGDPETLESIMEAVEASLEEFTSTKGVSASVEKRSETSLFDIMVIDFEAGDIEELANMQIIDLDTDGKVGYIGLEQSIANIEAEGFTCSLQS